MRIAEIRVNGERAGTLEEDDSRFVFSYDTEYEGPPVSLTMPIQEQPYAFDRFPPFFDGLLPEGAQLEALLRQSKLDRSDYFGQLVTVGQDLVGNVTVHPFAGFATSRDEEGGE